ncbi:MAG TPA: copper transporter [Gaiellaceae bacterium]
MFDLRYHVASLAAVFLMLVVGILVGIGISGRGFVSDAERTRLNADINSLREQRDAANASVDDLENRQQAAEDFVESAYPVLAENRLRGKRVGVLVLGPVDPSLGEIEQAVEEDAGGNVARIRALTLPLRYEQVENILDRNQELAGYAGDEALANLGRDLGRELAAGGLTPLWDALESELVEVKEGGLSDPVDAIVVMRTAEPQKGETSRFLAGVYQGLGGTGVPVVGVEPLRVEQTAIPVFQRHELSTVDGVDTELGKLGMILLLAGGDRGDYGTRDTAEDGILPPIEPLPPDGG